ncbi:MAG: sigma-70 family RNA polymerase sigma factor [Bacteroidota bacterium]
MDIAFPLKEDNLIKACARGERWAQRILYEEFYGKMMSVCLRYANSEEDALDILHEGFIKVFKNIDKYQVGTSLTAWIRRVMVNTSIDYYRKTIRRRTEDITEAFNLSSKEADAVSKCTEKEILSAVQLLTPAYRTVFNLYVMDGYSHKEIADMLEITESTSRSNLVKARNKLKQILTSRRFGYER